MSQHRSRFWQTDAEIDAYIEATKHLARRESLEDLRARLRRERDEQARAGGQVIFRGLGNPLYDAEMRVWRQRNTPRSSRQTTPGTMTFTTLRVKDD